MNTIANNEGCNDKITTLKINIKSTFDLWETKYKLELINNTDNIIVSTRSLGKTRIYFGCVLFKSTNEIAYIHYKYPSDDTICKASLIVDIFCFKSNKLVKTREFIIECGYSCGNVDGKICKIDDDKYTIILGDLTNNDYISVIEITNTLYKTPYRFDVTDIELDINYMYFLDKTNIIYSSIIADKTNYLHIGIFDGITSEPIRLITDYKLPEKYSHNFDECTEINSHIMEYANGVFLIKIVLDCKVDALHINEHKLLLLVKNDLVLEILEPPEDVNYKIIGFEGFVSTNESIYTINFNENMPYIGFLEIIYIET